MTINSLPTTTPLRSYGIHPDKDGILHLFQDISPRGWNFFGLDTDTNMSVKHLRSSCSHAINHHHAKGEVANKHWEKFLAISGDPLVQAMLPVPKGNVYYLKDSKLENYVEWMSCLERLNSPLHSWVKPFWGTRLRKLTSQLGLTNIHPIVLTGVRLEDASDVKQIVEYAQTEDRTLILCGEELVLPQSVIQLDTDIYNLTTLSELIKLPLEYIGVKVVKQYCQGELFPQK